VLLILLLAAKVLFLFEHSIFFLDFNQLLLQIRLVFLVTIFRGLILIYFCREDPFLVLHRLNDGHMVILLIFLRQHPELANVIVVELAKTLGTIWHQHDFFLKQILRKN
jgi:hypothetical protein